MPPESPQLHPSLKQPLLWVAAAIVILSWSESRITNFIHAEYLTRLAVASYRITLGTPHWQEFQNRVLGPFLVRTLSDQLNVSYYRVYFAAALCLHLLKNLLCLFLVYRLTRDLLVAAKYTILSCLLFLALQQERWLYLWDYLDNIIFLVFLFGVCRKKSDTFFAWLFLPAILNRESALFISAWMVLDAFELMPLPGSSFTLKLRNLQRLFVGAALTAAGVVFVYGTRKLLLVKETADLNSAFALERPFHLASNLKYYFSHLIDPSLLWLNLREEAAPVLILLAILILLWRKKLSDLILKQVILALMIFTSLVLFAWLGEIRIYNLLVPFALFWALLLGPDLPEAGSILTQSRKGAKEEE